MTKMIEATGISAIGASGYADPDHPFTISATANEKSISPAVGRHVTIRLNAASAAWAGKALLRYAWKPRGIEYEADSVFEKAFDAELERGIERAVEAGEEALRQRAARLEAIAERREKEAAR